MAFMWREAELRMSERFASGSSEALRPIHSARYTPDIPGRDIRDTPYIRDKR